MNLVEHRIDYEILDEAKCGTGCIIIIMAEMAVV